MPDNYYSEVNENGVVTPLRDLAAFPRSEQAVLGAVNFLHIPASVITQEKNHITYTITRNSGGEVTEIDADGTSNAAGALVLIDKQAVLSAGHYVLSGVDQTNNYQLYVNAMNGSSLVKQLANTYTGVVEFDVDYNGYDSLSIGFYVDNNKTLNHVKIHPMIALSANTPFAPYAMTNRELTDAVKEIEAGKIEVSGNSATFNVPLIRANEHAYTYGLITFSGGLYHFWLKSSDESDAVVITKIIDANSSRTLSATYANGQLSLTFSATIYGGVMVETNNVVKS